MSVVIVRLRFGLQLILAALLAVLFADLVLQIGSRYLFQRALIWTEEVSRFLLVWIVFLGAALAVHARAHFVVEILTERLPSRLHRWWRVAIAASLIGLMASFLYQGIVFGELGLHSRSPSLGLPMIYVYAAVPVSAACMILFLLGEIRQRLADRPG